MAELAPGVRDALSSSGHSSFGQMYSFGNSRDGDHGENHEVVGQASFFEAEAKAFADGLDAGWRLAELAAHEAESADMDAQLESLERLEGAWALIAEGHQALDVEGRQFVRPETDHAPAGEGGFEVFLQVSGEAGGAVVAAIPGSGLFLETFFEALKYQIYSNLPNWI